MSENILLLALLLIILIGFTIVVYLLSKRGGQTDVKAMRSLVDEVFGLTNERVTAQSKQILEGQREIIQTDLQNKQSQLNDLIKGMSELVDKRQVEIKLLEKERAEQFGSLAKQLQEQQRVTELLRSRTEELTRVLSSNQSRGGWGERIIEDLLRSNGLQKGVHYLVQSDIGKTGQRPDITLLLPDHRLVPVDVKFPFSALQQWAGTDDVAQKKLLVKQFSQDVKKHIDKVGQYIMPEEGTLDYVVLFVPNEAIFSFLNQHLPEVVDYAMSKRVLITSPFTFLIVARTIIESYRNFLLGDKLRGVLEQIDGFVQEWSKYRESLEKFGRAVESLGTSYKELTSTRTNQLEKRVERVQNIGQKALSSSKGNKSQNHD
jgi:DNA recombination protein RmuC